MARRRVPDPRAGLSLGSKIDGASALISFMEILQQLFEEHFHSTPDHVQPLRGPFGGSPRKLFRLSDEQHNAIGVLYNVREENVAFLAFSRHFRRHGLPVPEIYAEALDRDAYLEEDLGDTTLYELLAHNRQGEEIAPQVVEAYRKAVAVLPRFQVEAGRDLDYSVCYPRDSFDRQSITWDLNYFKYYFLRLAGISFHEQSLENDFQKLADFLLTAHRDYFLYRDFQSRNIMLREGEPYFLDYQGGRRGALQYDIASLLFDSKADLPPALRADLLEHYLQALATHIDLDRAEFMRHYYGYAYIRLMQAMGAYGFRGYYERKPHFLQSVPYAVKNLKWLLQNSELPVALPALMQVLRELAATERFAMPAETGAPKPLTVQVVSFSFKRGLPSDESEHGGGFVFDARALPNPGREEQFRSLTGKDAPVIEYLETQPAVHEFLSNVISLVDASVQAYQRRGFNHLMVSFGCTGGQHRSVYLAESLARHLRSRSGVEVVLQHRELEKLTA